MVLVKADNLPNILRRYTTSSIVEAVGAHADTVRAWKSGKIAPSVSHLEPLATFLDIDVARLVALIARERGPRALASAYARKTT